MDESHFDSGTVPQRHENESIFEFNYWDRSPIAFSYSAERFLEKGAEARRALAPC